MYSGPKEWQIAKHDVMLQQKLSVGLQISPIVAQVLINRGISSLEEAKVFLSNSLADLADPRELPDMVAALQRILQALEQGEQILVYGDYDVDGITSTALLTRVLRQLGGSVSYYIPERLEEGYGLNKSALEWAKHEAKIDLIITVDCGIASWEEVDYAKQLEIDIIITDHHQPGSHIPNAVAVINPKLDETSRLQNLAGVGVAFKLAQALCMAKDLSPVNGTFAGDMLDLVVLGTIADVVPLIGENRIIVKYGLPILTSSHRPGIKALIEVSGLDGKSLTTGQVAFALAPRLNAAGRLGSAVPAVELLLTDSEQRAWELANKLSRENEERQLVETQIYREVCEKIEQEIDLANEKTIVLASPLWHAGVIGIVASKITERYYRPTILMAVEGVKAKGSGRSIKGLNLFVALQECQEVLLKYGGHHQAAGMSLLVENIPHFKALLNEYAEKILTPDKLIPVLQIDDELALEEISNGLYKQLDMLQPFGAGNPEPVLCSRRVKVTQWREVGKNGNHLKAKILTKNKDLDAIGFNLAHLMSDCKEGLHEPVDLAFGLGQNEWNGKTSLQLVLKDLRYPSQPTAAVSNINNNLKNFLEKLLANSRLGVHSVIKAPLKRISTGLADFLKRHLCQYGVQIVRLDKHNALHDLKQATVAGKVFIATDVYWQQKQEMVQNCSIEIFEMKHFLSHFVSTPAIYDKRGQSKIGELVKLICSDKKILVYLNYRENAVELAENLIAHCPQLREKIRIFFSNSDIMGYIDPSLFQVLLTNQFMEFYNLPEVDTKVIYESPFSLEELNIRISGNKSAPVHLLWNPEDLILNEKMLKAMFPDQAFLLDLAAVVLNKKGDLPINTNALCSELNITAKRFDIIKLTSGLKILSELGIMHYIDNAYFLNKSSGKPDLRQSVYFAEGQTELAALSKFNNAASPWEVNLGVG